MTRFLRPGALSVSLAAVAGVGALPAATADRADRPPTVAGPLRLRTSHCYRHTCAYIYELDAASTSDRRASWRAFWVNRPSERAPDPGSCTTAIADGIEWGSGGRPGPPPARTYPLRATTAVAPGVAARLTVDAGGHARVPAKIRQRAGWAAGTAKAIALSGRLVALWEGRSPRRVQLTFGAEVRNPGTEFAGLAETYAAVDVPCSHVPPPAPGFSSRLERATVRSSEKAWLQVRIPGLLPRINYRTGLITWSGVGRATFTVSQNGANIAAQQAYDVYGRNAFALRYSPGVYVVRVALRGAIGTRQYALPLRVR